MLTQWLNFELLDTGAAAGCSHNLISTDLCLFARQYKTPILLCHVSKAGLFIDVVEEGIRGQAQQMRHMCKERRVGNRIGGKNELHKKVERNGRGIQECHQSINVASSIIAPSYSCRPTYCGNQCVTQRPGKCYDVESKAEDICYVRTKVQDCFG